MLITRNSNLNCNKGRVAGVVDLRRIRDWTLLPGATVEIRQKGNAICSGYVDAVTDDGKILWLRAPAEDRRLFEKAEFYEAWAAEDRNGFHYEVTRSAGTEAGLAPNAGVSVT